MTSSESANSVGEIVAVEEPKPKPGEDTGGDRVQPGRSSGRFAASLPCSRPVDWPTSMR